MGGGGTEDFFSGGSNFGLFLIFDRTTSTVEANSLRHPQGDPAIATVFGRKLPANSLHGGRMPNVTRAFPLMGKPDTK